MKKVLLSVFLGLLIVPNANAVPSCGSSLMPAFTANQATQLCKTFGSAVSQSLIPSADNTYDVGSTTFGWRTGYFDTSVITPLVNHATSLALGIGGTAEATLTNDTLTFSGAAASIVGGATSLTIGSAGSTIIDPANDPQRLITFSSSSDTVITQFFGDAGVTAAQTYRIGASTSDADDDSTFFLASGGGLGNTRGAYLALYGNDVTGGVGGLLQLRSGDTTAGNIEMHLENASTSFIVKDTTSGNLLAISDAGTATFAGQIVQSTTGTTLAVDSGTAASACKGTGPLNGATPVVISTTCAATGAIPFIQRTSTSTAVSDPIADTIVNGVSFSVTSVATDTGTFAWWILKEG